MSFLSLKKKNYYFIINESMKKLQSIENLIWNRTRCVEDTSISEVIWVTIWALIQYKDAILPVSEIPLWR